MQNIYNKKPIKYKFWWYSI